LIYLLRSGICLLYRQTIHTLCLSSLFYHSCSLSSTLMWHASTRIPFQSLAPCQEREDQDPTELVADSNTYIPFKTVDSALVTRILNEVDTLGQPDSEEPCGLVGALTKSLCYINQLIHPSTPVTGDDSAALPDPRILILSVSPDLSNSYIPIMNSIFSAQKLKVTIDVCKMFGAETVFLQQAAHLTGGSYIHLERRDALLQYLVMSFLPPTAIRKIISVPTEDRVDFRAACFCHKNIVDVGFVCSVCLSIFCQPIPVCSTCRTKFPIKTLQRLNLSRASSLPAISQTGATRPANGGGIARTPLATSGLAANLR